MQVRQIQFAALALSGCAIVALAGPALSQSGASAPARYTIDAGTVSGMAAMGAGGGGGGLGAVMGALRGGGSQAIKELQLRLGSGRAATGEPKGEHFMPAAAGLGRSVELLTPAPSQAAPRETGPMPQAQMPKGRLLLYWGCGEHAPAGQPVVIDFSKMAAGQVPPGLYAQSLNLPDEWRVLASNARTYGEWPHGRDNKTVPASASLLGAHKVTSTYAPEINFTMADDFMPALQPTSQNLPSGAVMLNWNGRAKATGDCAWGMGAQADRNGEVRDMVWWTSSASQAFGGPMADWLSPAAVARLVAAKTVLPPSQTSCAIPKEVKQAGGEMLMTNLYAYGPQADFSYPPRPARAAANWQPEWVARVRFRANAMVMLGMPQMGGFGGGDAGEDGDDGASGASSAPVLPTCKGGIAGRIARAAGLCR